jgi:hypothetical protein
VPDPHGGAAVTARAGRFVLNLITVLAFGLLAPLAQAQSQSGFDYNGIVHVSGGSTSTTTSTSRRARAPTRAPRWPPPARTGRAARDVVPERRRRLDHVAEPAGHHLPPARGPYPERRAQDAQRRRPPRRHPGAARPGRQGDAEAARRRGERAVARRLQPERPQRLVRELHVAHRPLRERPRPKA